MRCGRCGNDNAEANRFCGTCGAPLAAKPQAASQPVSVASVGNVATPASKSATQNSPIAFKSIDAAPPQPRSASLSPTRAEPRREPAISGPSFLGLDMPSAGADGGDHRDLSAGDQPLQASSGSLDYLLEDEEEPKRGGWKLILVVVVLSLAVGFAYLHWKRGGFDWLSVGEKKPAVTSPTPDSAPNSSDSGAASTANSAPPTPISSAPVTPIPTDGAAPSPTNSGATNATGPPDASQAATPSPTPDAAPSASPPGTPNGSGAAADSASGSSAAEQESNEEEAAAPAKPVARKPTTAKPSAAKPVASKSYDSVAEAERYLYGRGVGQDCDHGLRLLKPAAEQSNPKAMISLGALYSTGTCTPRDLPTAYRWFALALHKQPDNQVLQNDLQKLWSQMTQPERQLAIKLSQ